MTDQKILDIVREFDEKFVKKNAPHNGDGDKWPGEEGIEYYDTLIDSDDEGKVEQIKSFFLSSQASLIEKIVEMLVKEMEGLKKVPPNPNFGTSGAYNEANGFNAGISTAIECVNRLNK